MLRFDCIEVVCAHRQLLSVCIVVQDGYLALGDTQQLRDLITRVLPAWNGGDYGYGALLGMYAYG
jgi:hypothetical protein